jgi:hypothetical protein
MFFSDQDLIQYDRRGTANIHQKPSQGKPPILKKEMNPPIKMHMEIAMRESIAFV